MDILTLKRSHPVQGKPVDVVVLYNEQVAGALVLPFTGWIKLKRLLEKGSELDLREGGLLQLKLRVTGTADAATPAPAVLPVRTAVVKPLVKLPNYIAGEVEQEYDPDIAAAEAEAKRESSRPSTTEELIKSLKGEANE